MSQGSNLGSVGAGVGSAVRMLRNGDQKKFLSGLASGGATFFRTLTRVARILFLQVTGFVFLVIGAVIGFKAYEEYQRYKLGAAPGNRAAIAIFFAVIFGYYGISSFWRARK